MTHADHFFLGRLHKPHGLQGEIKAQFDADNLKPYLKLKSVWVEIKGRLVEKEVRKIRPTGGMQVIISFANLESIEQVEPLSGLALFLPESQLPPLKDGEFYYHEIVGFMARDLVMGDVGVIKEVQEMPAQDVLVIDHNGRETLLPVIDEFILGVDRSQKILNIAMPDGLLEVYLS